jgi:hypothetical protein
VPTGNIGTALNTATESVNNQVFGNASNYPSAMTSLSPEIYSTNKTKSRPCQLSQNPNSIRLKTNSIVIFLLFQSTGVLLYLLSAKKIVYLFFLDG